MARLGKRERAAKAALIRANLGGASSATICDNSHGDGYLSGPRRDSWGYKSALDTGILFGRTHVETAYGARGGMGRAQPLGAQTKARFALG